MARLLSRMGFVVAVSLVAALSPRADAGENYALLVAVGDYDLDELRPLKFTRPDVIEFHAALVESGFPPKNIVLLHDDVESLVAHYRKVGSGQKPRDFLPEGAKIRKQLELLLARLRPEDSIVVAFSGHGVQFKGEKKSYFCPADAKLDDKSTLVGFDEVFAALKECAAGRKLFLVDACQNDPLSEIGKSRSTVNLESVTRPQTEAVPEGIIALFSCKAGQKSFELPELGHGVFFYHLLDGWKGAADANGDGRLSYQELAVHTEKKTAEFAALRLKTVQTPQLKTDFSGEWILREIKQIGPSQAIAPFGAEQAKNHQTAWAKHLNVPLEIQNSVGMTLRLIPPGDYLRGSTPAQTYLSLQLDSLLTRERLERETPQHKVRLSKPFYLGTCEVTLRQFLLFYHDAKYKCDCEKDGKGGWGLDGKNNESQKPQYSPWSWGHPNQSQECPVVNVSWNDATAFCEWLSRRENRTYRLPTEAEWEYACRAGTTALYVTGDDPELLARVDNVADGSAKQTFSKWTTIRARDGYVHTAPIGMFEANPFGLHDMHGNVCEWCLDLFDAKEYAQYAGQVAVDPVGTSQGASHRVFRGGSWYDAPGSCRSASRDGNSPASGAAPWGSASSQSSPIAEPSQAGRRGSGGRTGAPRRAASSHRRDPPSGNVQCAARSPQNRGTLFLAALSGAHFPMAIRIFTIPLTNPEPSQADLNAFLRSHKVISVERRWIEQGLNSVWTFCVDYIETAGGPSGTPVTSSSRARVDYREILSPEDFAVFAKLRDLRKRLAQENTVPVYTIFTNEQLARMVQDRPASKSALEQIAGVGDARIEKYAEPFLDLLRPSEGRADETNGKPV